MDINKQLANEKRLLARLESDIAEYAKYYPNLKGIKKEIIEDYFVSASYWENKGILSGYSFVGDNSVSARQGNTVPDDIGVHDPSERNPESTSIAKNLWKKSDTEVVEFAREYFKSKIAVLESEMQES